MGFDSRIFSSRKGSVEITAENLIYLVLAAVAIIGLVALLLGLFGVFSGAAHGGTRNTLSTVYDAAFALYADANSDVQGCVIRNMFIEPDWSLVGFNKDGVRNANNLFACEQGNDCTQEMCGPRNQNVIKPRSCGRGACICICEGAAFAGVGDVDGEDCQKANALCRRFTANIGFDTLYVVEPQSDECSTHISGYEGSVCDLVVPGEECDAVGTDRGVRFALVMKKESSRAQGGENALLFDVVPSNRVDSQYGDLPNCDTVIETAQAVERTVVVEEAEPEADKGERTDEALKRAGATGITAR